MRTFAFAFVMAALIGITQSQTQAASTISEPLSASQAVNVAKDGVDASLRDRLISVYGVGAPTAIQTWWIIFYDPSVPSHGRVVKVDTGRISRAYPAEGGVIYDDALTFPRTAVIDDTPALSSTQDYASKHALAYDRVRILLRVTVKSQMLRWRVQLLDETTNRGFVFVNVSDGRFAMYAPPGSEPAKVGTGTGGGTTGNAQNFGDDVKNTFLGIGGDLEEFFTGERTVDK